MVVTMFSDGKDICRYDFIEEFSLPYASKQCGEYGRKELAQNVFDTTEKPTYT